MKKTLFVALAAAALMAMALVPAMAWQMPLGGTFGGYTITVAPDSLQQPWVSGAFTITGSSEYGTVNLTGTYATTQSPQTLTVQITGTIETPEATYDVNRTFTFTPDNRKVVWKQIVAWIETLIGA